ncbi:MAG: AraC family transcriptional regulator [Myxococcota bacterium]
MPVVPCISAGAFRKLLDAAEAFGCNVAEVRAAAHVDAKQVDDKDARIPVERLHALWEVVLERVPRADAALVVATHYAPGDYGLVGFVCANCATLGEAMQQMVRFSRLWTDEPGMKLDAEGTVGLVYPAPRADRPGFRMANEAALAEILHAARTLTQQDLVPARVAFAHPAPKDTRAHREFFRCRVDFGAPAHDLSFGAGAVSMSLPKADPQLGAFLHGLANDALAKRHEPETFMDQVRQRLAETLQKGVPELPELATQLAMSERTLRRRLEEEGTSFRELLDDTRARLAKGYLQDSNIPLSEVAFLLGFSEPSAFHRAFKRWTGMTPAAARAGSNATSV